MPIRQCEACGQSNNRVLLENQKHVYYQGESNHTWIYNLAKCENCGLVYIDPKPNWELLQTFYGSDYGCYDSSSAPPEAEANSLKYRLASWRYPPAGSSGLDTRARQFLAVASEWLSGKTISYSLAVPLSLPKDANIFELGYGSGNWLLAMSQLGYQNLYGYDIDANGENIHRLQEAGIQVTADVFLHNQYPEGFFDCIRLEHVFEHLDDPIAVMSKCCQMLNPNGVLLMNFPCSRALSFKLSVKYFAHRDSPRHLYLHTPTSTRLILKSAGFRTSKLKSYPVSLVFAATLNNWLRIKNIQIPSKLFSILSPFYALLSFAFKNGENITVMAVKDL